MNDFILSKLINIAHAEGSQGIVLPDPLGGATIDSLITKIFKFAAFKAGPVIVNEMVLDGASQMLFANGEAEKFTKGKNTIVFAIIGYALLLMATGISALVQSALTGNLPK